MSHKSFNNDAKCADVDDTDNPRPSRFRHVMSRLLQILKPIPGLMIENISPERLAELGITHEDGGIWLGEDREGFYADYFLIPKELHLGTGSAA
jgi:hypothetical protein